MENKTNRDKEKNIVVSINGKESNIIPLKHAIDKWQTVIDIVTIESGKNNEIRTARSLSVCVNGKNVVPKDVRGMNIEDVQTIEIFGSSPVNNIR